MFNSFSVLHRLMGTSYERTKDARAFNSDMIDLGYGQKSKPRDDEDCVIRQALPPIQDNSYIELVRIALCYYIAKADGVSEDEQAAIDEMCTNLLEDPNTNPDYRTELRMIMADKGTNFANVRRYLNRVPNEELEKFKEDVMRIAEMTDGITDNEKQAIKIFQNYLDDKKNWLEPEKKKGHTRIVPLKCASCGATIELTTDRESAYCTYCGSNHLIERD